MVTFLKNIFSSALKTNTSLEKGVLTGCLRISKESIFTGLNNFKVHSILDAPSETAFGFTQAEVQQLLDDYELSSHIAEVREWYDGYLFGTADIYNPWSTLMYIDRARHQETPDAISFWANTSSNDIIYKYIQEADSALYQEFEQLMHGHSVEKTIKPELTYRDMDDISNIYSFLLLTGYLKATKQTRRNTYLLVIPNREVYEIYNDSFMEYFTNLKHTKKSEFIAALVEEDVVTAERILSFILRKGISYYDNKESFYHGFLYGLFDGYQVESNRESGDDRLDLIIYPEIFKDKAIVIECKHSDSEDQLVSDSKEGAEQLGNAYANHAGAGAAGGLGFAFLSFLNTDLVPGIDLILRTVHLEQAIADSDIVVTGEGRLDHQTAMGKAPVGVARLAKKYGARTIAFAGSVTPGATACNAAGIDAFFPIVRGITTLEDAMKPENAKENLRASAEQVFRLLII